MSHCRTDKLRGCWALPSLLSAQPALLQNHPYRLIPNLKAVLKASFTQFPFRIPIQGSIYFESFFPPFMPKKCSFTSVKIFFPLFGEYAQLWAYHMSKEHTKGLISVYLNTLQRNWLRKMPLIHTLFHQKLWRVCILTYIYLYAIYIHMLKYIDGFNRNVYIQNWGKQVL